MRELRVELPSGVPARLGAFAVVLVLASGGGWVAGQAVGPVELPAVQEMDHGHMDMDMHPGSMGAP